jgi:multiphosphoryl transfer protein
MIGLVIVAHSRALAQALLDLSQQVSVSEVPMAIAAGAGPDRQDFGTDALEIMEAIESVYSDDGVLILMDLGSAVLSAQMAVDLLPPEMQANVRFCAAPVVEGAIAAAVQAGLGSDLETVCREASQALLPKQEQLGIVGKSEPEQATAPEAPAGDEKRLILTLQNEHGLHARPAARFVQQAGHFQAEIQVKNLTTGRGPVSAKSLNALATLGAIQDHQIEILAHGPEADHALAALKRWSRRILAKNLVRPFWINPSARKLQRLSQERCSVYRSLKVSPLGACTDIPFPHLQSPTM